MFRFVAASVALTLVAISVDVLPPTLSTTVALCVPLTSPDNEPVKVDELPETFPVIFAVIVPALKLPDASRLTILDAVFKLVAAFAANSAE